MVSGVRQKRCLLLYSLFLHCSFETVIENGEHLRKVTDWPNQVELYAIEIPQVPSVPPVLNINTKMYYFLLSDQSIGRE